MDILKELEIAQENNNPNVISLVPEEEKLSLGIERIRELRSFLAIRSTTKSPRVAIIHAANTLTEEAQNALLKTLEEPPDNTYLILLSEDLRSLLPTIQSRCQIIELSGPTVIEIADKESQELSSVLGWIGEGNIPKGFVWSQAIGTDRPKAVSVLDKLLFIAHQQLIQGSALQKAPESRNLSPVIRRLFLAKKYLRANTNVRLTLENLFLN